MKKVAAVIVSIIGLGTGIAAGEEQRKGISVVGCLPIGQTSKGDLVYTMDCHSVPGGPANAVVPVDPNGKTGVVDRHATVQSVPAISPQPVGLPPSQASISSEGGPEVGLPPGKQPAGARAGKLKNAPPKSGDATGSTTARLPSGATAPVVARQKRIVGSPKT